MISLYLKIHNVTGLKYLGQTKQDPYCYRGSGTRWRNHIKKHGNDVSTIILEQCENYDILNARAKLYSTFFDVVNSPDFANLIPEHGNKHHNPQTKKDNSFKKGSKWVTNGTNTKLILEGESIPLGYYYGRSGKVTEPKSSKTKLKMSNSHSARPKRANKVFTYTCKCCNIKFTRNQKAKTENVFCSRSCRGKSTPRNSNPTGRNQYSKIKEL